MTDFLAPREGYAVGDVFAELYHQAEGVVDELELAIVASGKIFNSKVPGTSLDLSPGGHLNLGTSNEDDPDYEGPQSWTEHTDVSAYYIHTWVPLLRLEIEQAVPNHPSPEDRKLGPIAVGGFNNRPSLSGSPLYELRLTNDGAVNVRAVREQQEKEESD